ncbi:NUDIX domain-containing protein [Chitinimonas arctica]|uniref:NUDIX domain-containing protein n=1 Tax=Chitinimonas arctica TaxID=2594795 RepID=A0A516SBI6_9NEIS|nr:bifunctional nicotinamide-nucleotide adenylyltransferase/Nudix hydroxylase [Chitinimonas arctica]QDQ25428.1 NUDIX domain-containing protein [Chitinimonas arctica]
MDFDTLVYIGRFQPLHNSHLALLRQALARAEHVLVVLGSAGQARSCRNPFTAAERQDMVRASLGKEADRVRFVGIRDYYDGARWRAALQQAVTAAIPAGRRIGLIGHLKNDSTRYLQDFPDWPLLAMANIDGRNATDLRARWFEAEGDVEPIATHLPPPVSEFLRHFSAGADFAALLGEYRYLGDYRQAWAAAPYPPVFVTVDAVVHCCGHVLLIRRGGYPGKGCWALPGGFLDPRERVADAALRELREETGLLLPAELANPAASQHALFDHPDRSPRGRTLSHAFYYPLPLDRLPAIQAADDAAAARWVPVASLAGMEAEMFEDHLLILDRFLGLL